MSNKLQISLQYQNTRQNNTIKCQGGGSLEFQLLDEWAPKEVEREEDINYQMERKRGKEEREKLPANSNLPYAFTIMQIKKNTSS